MQLFLLMLLTVKMSTREDSCQNVCVFVTWKGGLCLELSCMLSAKRDRDPPPLRILSPLKSPRSPKKEGFYRQEEKCVIPPSRL